MNFQDMIASLKAYWASQGCLIQEGYDVEVGAGTMNPSTALRCLGPEPYSTVYVEPSRRPADGRYGKNPNRLQFYHQMQVIIKPSVEKIQQLYLKSLEACGLNLDEHDIRFVQDDWENPTIGAWGLGWEVWADGMEITQFTYFQAVGGVTVDPVTVELTYGLERLAMYLQKVDSIFDLKWNDQFLYKDLYERNEWEWSHYNFTHASVKMWKQHFVDFEQEAKKLAESNWPLPAYDFVLKASHAFNMLDARGVISVSERQHYIGKIRDLAKLVALSYIEARQALGFPLGSITKTNPSKPVVAKFKKTASPQDFLLEIGSEHLPALAIPRGIASLKSLMQQLLKEHELTYESLEVFSGVRRLAILVKGLIPKTEDQVLKKKGPSLSKAFIEGSITPAATGFLKSAGIKISSLKEAESHPHILIEPHQGEDHLFIQIEKQGISTCELLYHHLPSLISSISFPKTMRWANYHETYARPICWLVALYGEQVIPFSYAGITASNVSRGHDQLNDVQVEITQPSLYEKTLAEVNVIACARQRKELLKQQLHRIESSFNVQVMQPEALLNEVVYLSEFPQATLGSFDPSFLKLPQKVITSEMIHHQRYFPTLNDAGALHSQFVIVCDTNPSSLIVEGNQKALTARLNDGTFLFEEDLKTPLSTFENKLKAITFLEGCGSLIDKTKRLEEYIEQFSALITFDVAIAKQGAHLSKIDLPSGLVGEFPELQGVCGQIYAKNCGVDAKVAEIIQEHWMPLSDKEPLPSFLESCLVSIADKLDNLITCFALGLEPTSSTDPYALRRQSLGIVKMMLEYQIDYPFEVLLGLCVKVWEKNLSRKVPSDLIDKITLFVSKRAETVLAETFSKELLPFVLSQSPTAYFDAYLRLEALMRFHDSQNAQFSCLKQTTHRIAKMLSKNNVDKKINPHLFAEKVEANLYQHLQSLETHNQKHLSDKQYLEALKQSAMLSPYFEEFFNEVKVLDDNPEVRDNRLALLKLGFDLLNQVISF